MVLGTKVKFFERRAMTMKREGGKGRVRETISFHRDYRNSFTLFVDDLPSTIDTWWLRKMFDDYGEIVDAYIPRKTRVKSRSKFGFVRYRHRSEAELAIEKMNGTRRHNVILKVNLAQYGRERAAIKKADGYHNKGEQRKTYRQVLMGENLSCNNGADFYHPQSALMDVEAIKSRVAVLEREVARLQQALTYAMSVGKSKKDSDASSSFTEGQQMEEVIGGEGGNTSTIIEGQQMEEVSRGEGGIASLSGVGISGLKDVFVSRIVGEESSMLEVVGCDRVIDVTTKKVDMGESVGSFTGDRRPADSGEGNSSLSGVINVINSREAWDSKEEIQSSAVIEVDELNEDLSDSGNKRPAGNGEGGDSLSGDTNVFNSRDFSDFKEEDISAGLEKDEGLNESRSVLGLGLNGGDLSGSLVSHLGQNEEGPNSINMDHLYEYSFVKPIVDTSLESIDMNDLDWANLRDVCDSSEDEDALKEFELYREYFDTFKDCKHTDYEIEGDRKSCIAVNIRKRTRGQKKKKRKSKRRNYAIFRWMGVKRRFAYVFSRRIFDES